LAHFLLVLALIFSKFNKRSAGLTEPSAEADEAAAGPCCQGSEGTGAGGRHGNPVLRHLPGLAARAAGNPVKLALSETVSCDVGFAPVGEKTSSGLGIEEPLPTRAAELH